MKTETKVIIAGAAIAVIMLLTQGCNTGMVSSRVETTTTTIATNGTPVSITQKNDVTLLRGTVLVNSEVDKAKIQWGDVKVAIGGYSTVGDVDSVNALGNAITRGIMAYFTGGGSEAVKSAVMAGLLTAQPSASTNAPAIK
jgi:hypothetical protein